MTQATPPKIQLQYVDRPDVQETFCDSLEKMFLDGPTQSMRLEFCVTRMDEPKPGQNVATGKKHTASRLILPMATFVDMANKFQRMVDALEKQGLVKKNVPTPQPGSTAPS